MKENEVEYTIFFLKIVIKSIHYMYTGYFMMQRLLALTNKYGLLLFFYAHE